jgi:hypothetical protein
MKKLMIITICLVTFFTNLKAQTNHSFGARVGTLTALENHDYLVNGFFNVSLLGIAGTFSTQAEPQIGLQYSTELSQKRTLNVIATHQKIESFWNTEKISEASQISLIGKMDLVWFEGKHTNWYSGIGAGVAFKEVTNYGYTPGNESSQRLIAHATVLGVKTKGKTTIFAEVGAGALGIFSGGVKHTF